MKAKANVPQRIDLDSVLKVYSGKSGCACGCNGKYSYSSLHEGTDGPNADEVSDVSVARQVLRFNRLLENVPPFPEARVCYQRGLGDEGIYFLETKSETLRTRRGRVKFSGRLNMVVVRVPGQKQKARVEG